MDRFVSTFTNKIDVKGRVSVPAPFRAVLHSGSDWVQHGFATVCALLLYGLGLGYLARWSQGRA